MYRVCGHCHQQLGEKAYKEHARLYLKDGVWWTESQIEHGEFSTASSEPMTLSDPPDSMEPEKGFPPPSGGELSDIGDPEDYQEDIESDKDDDRMEYWEESENELKQDCDNESEGSAPDVATDIQDRDTQRAVWWIVAFTCIIQSLHSLPSRSVDFLLKFLVALLLFLSRYSRKIEDIARNFPSTLYTRLKYLRDKLCLVPINSYVICTKCHSLHKYAECFRSRAGSLFVKNCTECKVNAPLLRQVLTSCGNKRFYPYSIYPYCSLISVLQSFFKRPGFFDQCCKWKSIPSSDPSILTDVYSGSVWRDFIQYNGQPFLSEDNGIAFMLNVDWFQPFKHRNYAIGVLYLVFMNLPRDIRFKRENIVLLGLIPGPSKPPLDINSYLTPHVGDLLSLWKGVSFKIADNTTKIIRCALLCVACDLPAGRKVCGFLSYKANLGCSKCYSSFSTGVFGKSCYGGFERSSWTARSNEQHRKNIAIIQRSSTKTERHQKESEFGCRYLCLLQLPYFDPVKMLVIDPMHNLFLGTAKSIVNKVWIVNGLLTQADLKKINRRISSVVIPKAITFNRLPLMIDHCSSWTAEQLMIWVNFYSLYCLYNILPSNDYECWRHFVLASRLLAQRSISKRDVAIADRFLMQFCCRFESLYGKDAVTPNIHMHCHLSECILEYGPMSSFWLFSFERYNGVLGDEPTNNRSIELQLMKRFVQDNCHVQMIATGEESDVMFDNVVKQHALGFHSTRHLDTRISNTSLDITSASKYTIATLSPLNVSFMFDVYLKLYPQHQLEFTKQDFVLPSFHKKMLNIKIGNQQYHAGHFVFAESVFEICSHSTSSLPTLFFNPNLHAAQIQHFLVHSFELCNTTITRTFAAVKWLLCHPQRHSIGHPLQVWSQQFEDSPKNFIIPVENIHCLLVIAEFVSNDQAVYVTVPLI